MWSSPRAAMMFCDVECVGVDDRFVCVGNGDVTEGDFAGVDAVGQYADHLVTGPGTAYGGAVPVVVESFCDGTGSDAFIGIGGVDRAHDGLFVVFDLQYAGFEVGCVAVWPHATAPASGSGFAFHAVDHAVDDDVAFEFGEHAEQLQQHPAHGGGSVDRFGRGSEHDFRRVEFVEQFHKVAQTPRESIHAIDQQDVNHTCAGCRQCLLQAGSVGVRAGRVVGESFDLSPSGLGFDVGVETVVLRFDRIRLVFLVSGAANQPRRPWGGLPSPPSADLRRSRDQGPREARDPPSTHSRNLGERTPPTPRAPLPSLPPTRSWTAHRNRTAQDHQPAQNNITSTVSAHGDGKDQQEPPPRSRSGCIVVHPAHSDQVICRAAAMLETVAGCELNPGCLVEVSKEGRIDERAEVCCGRDGRQL